MEWVKIPKENHPIFRAALPSDPRVEEVTMFGGVAAKVGGHMACGLFARSVCVRLPEGERAAVVKLGGSDGAPMGGFAMLPDAMMSDRASLRGWMKKAIDHTATLAPKSAKKGAKKSAKKAAKKTAKKPVKRSARREKKPTKTGKPRAKKR